MPGLKVPSLHVVVFLVGRAREAAMILGLRPLTIVLRLGVRARYLSNPAYGVLPVCPSRRAVQAIDCDSFDLIRFIVVF